MDNIIKKLNYISERRIEFFEAGGDKFDFYKWSKTYFEQIPLELEEALAENKQNNSVYLEDEFWDVFWDYLCLLNTLKAEWK